MSGCETRTHSLVFSYGARPNSLGSGWLGLVVEPHPRRLGVAAQPDLRRWGMVAQLDPILI